MEAVSFDGTYEGWLAAARRMLYADTAPGGLDWQDRQASQALPLWGETVDEDRPAHAEPAVAPRFQLPKRFFELARLVSCHREPQRWSLLYKTLWRLTHGEQHLLEVTVDADVHQLLMMEKAVRRDLHKMRAFVRFREIETPEGAWFVAWYEPQHLIVGQNASFFRERFAGMRWSILTPECCVHWDLSELHFTSGVDRSQAPAEDAVEDLWRAYYGSIFNPARVKVRAMTSQMPRRFWKNLPEAQDISSLIAAADQRVQDMRLISEAQAAVPAITEVKVPDTENLDVVRKALQGCRGCPLWKDATCAVFGEGPPKARVFVVGEQPGDQEDRAGRPFVGPAGQLLNRALAAAKLSREQMYVTNAVKHFKWTPRGKRRIHARPSAREVAACRPWLEAEIRAVGPSLIVCLGSTAASSILGEDIKVTQRRGEILPTAFGIPALITIHPSALLRLPDGRDPAAEFAQFVSDLSKACD